MPNVTIEVRKHYTKEQEEGMIEAVHAGLMAGIKTPAWDRTIRLLVHEPHRFATPPDKVWNSRGPHQSAAARKRSGELGIRGGVPASEVDLGFKVDV